MVKSHKQPRSLPATERSMASATCSAGYMESTYCVVLHVVEAINFYGHEVREAEREQIIMNAVLNTIDFEVEGTPSATAETIIFNSNCIWECDMAGIKRIKTDHRPVKVTFYSSSGNSERKVIGSLLLPVRGLPVLGTGGNNSPTLLKMFWHKLTCLSSEFRSHKPEILLMLAIIKKSLLHTKDFKHLITFNDMEKQTRIPPLQSPGHSITASMLQSQANVYVQSLVQLGLLQVGNDPLVDCDIIEVVLQLKELRNLNKFVKSLYNSKETVDSVLLMFDFVGNVTNIDLKLNSTDTYTLNDVLGLRFKSSLRSIRMYFHRIFYLPINMYINGSSIANYRMDFGKLLPPDSFFSDQRKYVHSGSFAFERFGRMGSARDLKPIMDYTFTVEIQEVYWRQQEKEPESRLQPRQYEEQISLHSIGSKAVIRELPKDRAHDPERNAEQMFASVNGSVASLNVGAELSASDERDTDSESAHSDLHASKSPSQLQASPWRRRKFTRLLGNDARLEAEEEKCNDPKLVSQMKCPRIKFPDEEDEDGVFPDDESGPEINVVYSKRNLKNAKDSLATIVERPNAIVDVQKRDSNDRAVGGEKQPSKSRDERTHIEPMQGDELQERQSKLLLVERTSKKIKKNPLFNDFSEMEDRINNDVWVEMEQERDSNAQSKEERPRRIVKPKATEEQITQREPRNEREFNKLKIPQKFTDSNEVEATSTGTRVKGRITRKEQHAEEKKSAKKAEELELEEKPVLQTIPCRSALTSRPSVIRKKFLAQDILEATDLEELHQESLIKRDSRQRKKVGVDFSADGSTATETEELEDLFQKTHSRKFKGNRYQSATETELNETGLFKKMAKSKKTTLAKENLTLSARWVEVNKEQKRALAETEMFVKALSQRQLNESSYDTQMSESSKSLSIKKVQRKKKPEYNEINTSSEVESSIPSSQIEEPKTARKIVKKKNSAESLKDRQSMEIPINSESEPSVNEPGTGRKISKKKKSADFTLNQNLNAFYEHSELESCVDDSLKKDFKQGNVQPVPMAVKTMKSIDILQDHGIESQASTRKSKINQETAEPKKKKRQVIKKSCLQMYLDAEISSAQDTGHLPLSRSHELEQQVQKSAKKSAQAEIRPEVDPCEQEPLPRAHSLRQNTNQVSSASRSEQDIINALCGATANSSIQRDVEGQVSRLEVTVHMFDETKAKAPGAAKAKSSTKCADQSVNTDISNMDESMKQILETGKQLQVEMHRKVSEFMENLGQWRTDSDVSQHRMDNPAQSSDSLDQIYQAKFNEMEHHIAVLEKHLRKFESCAHEMQQENAKLKVEKVELTDRIVHMEKQIAEMQYYKDSNGLELQKVLGAMRLQNVRYLDMSRAKDRYKKQWRRSAKRVHALKLAMYEKAVQNEQRNMPSNVLNLKNILTQDAADFEREYGRFRKGATGLSFSGSGHSPEPLVKDYLLGLSSYQHLPDKYMEGSRLH